MFFTLLEWSSTERLFPTNANEMVSNTFSLLQNTCRLYGEQRGALPSAKTVARLEIFIFILLRIFVDAVLCKVIKICPLTHYYRKVPTVVRRKAERLIRMTSPFHRSSRMKHHSFIKANDK